MKKYLPLLWITILGTCLRWIYIDQPMRYDEAVTYSLYTSDSFVRIITDYNIPTNHVFHTILSRLSYLTFNNLWISLRYPAFLFGILMIPLAFCASWQLYLNYRAALLSSIFIACSSILIEFSTNARGYTLINAIFLGLIALSCRALRTLGTEIYSHKRLKQIYSGILAIPLLGIGFYTMPTFALQAATLAIFAALWPLINKSLVSKAKLAGYWLTTGTIFILGGCFGIVLYAPIIYFNSVAGLLNNRWASPAETISEYSTYLANTLPESIITLLQDTPWLWAPLIGIGLICACTSKSRKTSLLLLSSAFISFISICLYKYAYTPPRVLLYIFIVMILIASNGLVRALEHLEQKTQLKALFIYVATSYALISSFIILKNDSILESKLTAVFPPAKEAAAYLNEQLQPGDKIAAILPANYPLYFYLKQLGKSELYIYEKTPGKFRNLFIITDTSNNQDPSQVLDKLNIKRTSSINLVHQSQSWALYKMTKVPN